MTALDELRETFASAEPGAPPVTLWSTSAIIEEIDAFEAAHPGLEDYTETCVVCGGPMKISGSTLVCTADYGRTIGWQHSGCVGKPAVTE